MKNIDIHLVIRNGEIESVRNFLENGGDVREKDRYDCEPLIYAIKHNRIEIAKLLLAARGNINCYSILRGDPIGIAVWNLNLELVKFVVDNGADINRIKKNETPLDMLYKMKNYILPNQNNKNLEDQMEQLLVKLGAKTFDENKL